MAYRALERVGFEPSASLSYILGPPGEIVRRQAADRIRRATTFVLAVFLWLHAILFLDFQSPLITKLSGLAKLTSAEVVLLVLLFAFSLLAGSGFWRMLLSILYIYFFPFVLFWRLFQIFVVILRLINAWLNAQRGPQPSESATTTTTILATTTPPTQPAVTAKPGVKKDEPLWRYLVRPFQKFTFLWCILLLITTHRSILSICLLVVSAQLARKVFFVLKFLYFSDVWWQKYRIVMFAGLQKTLDAFDAITPDVGPSNELKNLIGQLDLWEKILKFLTDSYLMSRWGALMVAVVLGTIYTYFAFLFSFLYHGLAYAWGVKFAWPDALVTSAFIPFLIADLPKAAVVRLVGGIHCALILAVGVGTIVKFFRRRLDDIRKSAEEMSKRLTHQSVREKYLLVREKSLLPEQKPATPPIPQPKVRKGRKAKKGRKPKPSADS